MAQSRKQVGSKAFAKRRPGTKGNKHKFAGRNNGPSRQKYWASGRLKAKKVKALMIHCGLTRVEASALWEAARTTRRK